MKQNPWTLFICNLITKYIQNICQIPILSTTEEGQEFQNVFKAFLQ